MRRTVLLQRSVSFNKKQRRRVRLIAMLARVGYDKTMVFTGGVARNACIVKVLHDRLDREVLIPDPPDIVGALGAALHAENRVRHEAYASVS